ncbi:RlpA-like double-psi beta-barrel-protein domain-containing protein-containing protein [Lentinula raphanica]|nr:RlpA-like double-psi beta-barrel-protein domain-containing protein-containing protein [Lentinula raphanica]
MHNNSRRSLLYFLLSLCAFQFVLARHEFDPLSHRRHTLNANLAKREAASFRRETSLEKRFDDARFTYYAVGLGACGQTNQPSDFIVALNSAQYNGGQYCFEMITITVGDKSIQAQIMDECPGCPYGGLDLSEGAFQAFASLDQGVLTGSWDFDSAAPSTTTETPTSTYTPPTSTWSPPPTTSSTTTWTPTSTSTRTSSSFSSSSSSTSTTSTFTSLSTFSSSSSVSTATTSSATPTVMAPSGALGMFEEAVMQMGLAAASAAGATIVH